ncbi:MAG TPA: peroxide stress protein YaaA [Bacteroidales bacterium]|nr:peroxide stress protein YaaA [Bacteroidales bacterium]
MIVLLSPAKSLDFESPAISDKISEPLFPDETSELLKVLSKLSANDLQGLMSISPALAELNYNRFREMKDFPSEVPGKQAILVFVGEVYRGLSAGDFSEDDLQFAQKHLRILSGFYGVLRPMDLIQPYRLEMSTKLKIGKHDNLYKFWGDKITYQINKDLLNSVIVNLASDEYFKSVNKKLLQTEVITPVFYDQYKGKYRMLTVYAKNARGAMTRYIIKNRVENHEELKNAGINGYKYSPEMSDKWKWVFKR